jgi:4-hydroxybenzoate polyprenyltransferase
MRFRLFRSFRITLDMIKVEHTLFALPFAFLGAFLGADGFPALPKWVWIILAMVGARSAAMSFNRWADHAYDAQNPRTRGRALPAGQLSRCFIVAFIAATSSLFIFACYRLNWLSLALSPVALLVVFFYSFTKRFTWTSHFFLGLSLACAPIGGWVAIRGTMEPGILLFGLVVALWIAGGDILYACLDIDFDRQAGLFSIPVRWGIAKALRIALGLHLSMLLVLALAFFLFGLGWISWVGYLLVAGLLALEHRLVSPTDIRRVNTAFFTMNAVISSVLFLTVAADLVFRR